MFDAILLSIVALCCLVNLIAPHSSLAQYAAPLMLPVIVVFIAMGAYQLSVILRRINHQQEEQDD